MAEDPTVLVVDDEPDVCWALDTLLRRERLAVVAVSSGSEALGWLKQTPAPCQLILLDAKLPDIEGVELAGRIRTETSCAAPIVLVSGYFYRDDSLVQENLRTGLISAFVTKPFRHQEILSVINTLLPRG